MYNIKYLLVNDAGSKSRACNSRHRFIPHIGHCIELSRPSKSLDERATQSFK